jgi:hypothetical protein
MPPRPLPAVGPPDPAGLAAGRTPRVPYGPPLDSMQDDGVNRGILGLFLCSDLRRQVYTLTDWIKKNDFSPVYGGNRRVQDPLIGNRAVPGTEATFILPGGTGATAIHGLPDFVYTKGAVFLMYPGNATLQKLTVEHEGTVTSPVASIARAGADPGASATREFQLTLR